MSLSLGEVMLVMFGEFLGMYSTVGTHISNVALVYFPQYLQSPVWEDPYVGSYRDCGEKILVLTW